RADDWQPERDVDRLAEGNELDGYQSLVVIAGDDDVELAALGAHEHGIGRKRTADLDPACPARLDRGHDRVRLLASKQPVFGAVAIAATTPCFASSTARTIVSYAARPASALRTPGSNRPPSAEPYTIGSHTSVTRPSPAARSAISGPIPAGSPAVMAMRGFMS